MNSGSPCKSSNTVKKLCKNPNLHFASSRICVSHSDAVKTPNQCALHISCDIILDLNRGSLIGSTGKAGT